MRAWAETVIAESDPQTLLWDASFQFGDWLDPDAPADLPGRAKTQPDVVATAHVFRTLTLTARAAERLGENADAQRYAELAERVRLAFLSAYVTPAGRMVSDAPTAYAMAIVYGIAVEPDLRATLGDRLASLVRASGFHIGTGFVGTPIILDALTATGHVQTAERLLLQTENPSWLYPVTMGATTIWERWDSMLEDGSINPGEMTSFNHYAFGAVADWLHRRLAGLAPDAAGYRRIRIEPLPLPALSFARAHLDSPYGLIRSGWTRSADGTVVVEAQVPPGTTATVVLPDGRAPFAVGSGSHRWTVDAPASHETLRELSLASDLGEVLDDREAYVAVMTAIRSVAPEGAIRLRRQALWSIRRTLGESIAFMPGAVTDAVLEALAILNSRRGPRH
jgi:alpha-L-rhamnosidase